MEEREIVILGLDFSTIPLIRELCSRGYSNILVIDHSIEPGAFTGTYSIGGFVIEKLYILLDRESGEILRELGAKISCTKPRVRVAKPGNLYSKISCWERERFEPWWISRDLSEICFIDDGSSRFVKEKILSGCAEYTFYTPRKIDLERKIIVLRNGRVVSYKKIFVSYPLRKILEIVRGINIERDLLEDVSSINWLNIISISLGVRGSRPEWDIVTHATRASRSYIFLVVSNIDLDSAPEGYYLVNLQMSYCKHYPPPPDAIARGVAEARWARLLEDKKSIVLERIYVVSHISPLNDLEEWKLERLKEIFSERDLYITGLRGESRNISLREQLRLYRDLLKHI
ncbi:MAG: hypothetical protein ABWJ42_00305 [Sulfolobales archaeon]